MTAPKITGLSTRMLTLPLHRPWGAGAAENHVIVTKVATEAGTGCGFCYPASGRNLTADPEDYTWKTANDTYALGGMACDNGYLVFGNDKNHLYVVK